MEETEHIYKQLGARFVTPYPELKKKSESIKAFVFDWDGVFNDGRKNPQGGSNFSEVDSMGTNLLRYSYYLKHHQLPFTAIISGEKNDSAFYFCERECFHASFFKIADKSLALKFLCESLNIKSEQVAYFFDDVLDLPIAEQCGLRIMINQKSNPLFAEHCIKNNLVDYLSASSGGNFAVREACELIMALNCNYDEVLHNRKDFSNHYKAYLQLRRATLTQFYTLQDNVIVRQEHK